MPIRTASLNPQLQKNGARLHLAMQSRIHSQGADQPPSDQEQALLDERRALKDAKVQREAQAKAPKQKAVKVAKEAKPVKAKAPKAAKAAKEPKEAKAGKDKNKPTRAEKSTKKAENLEAAKKATKKSAKT